MNTINGRIQHQASKRPLKDLIVVAYDFDISSNNEIISAIDDENYSILASIFLGSDTKEDSNLPKISPGDRIGSTITDKNGSFQFSFEDSDFQRGDKESRPDIILFILAPDSAWDQGEFTGSFMGTPEHLRILHMSFYPLRNAGRSESLIEGFELRALLEFSKF